MKKIILIISLIICFIFNSVSIYAIETTQVNTEENLEEIPSLMIDIYNTVPYQMENGDIIYLPEILEEYPFWAVFVESDSEFILSAAEYITYLPDGRVKFGIGVIYGFANNNTNISSLYTSNQLMWIKGSHSNSTYSAASPYVIGDYYSVFNAYDASGALVRTANLVKVTEEDPDVPVDPEDPDVPVDPEDPDVPVDPEDPDVPVDPEDPDVPVDNTELTEAIKENNSILNRIYKLLNNFFIIYLFFNTLPFITTIAKRLGGKEFR